MRKLLSIVLLLLGAAALHAQDYEQLDSLMNVYVRAMQTGEAEDKMAEVDYMIGASADSLTRQHIALKLFDYYKESPLMGEEEVAIHIFDEWFDSGKVQMRSEFEKMDAKLFADFNRSTLLGMDAPALLLRKPCGGKMTVPARGKTALLWFFDTACGKCKLEAEVLPGVLEQCASVDADLYAVYTGQSKKEWRAFRRSFKIKGKKIKVIHLWDPTVDSDYLRLYGVISTPKLYMVEPGGSIIGRRLEVDNLPEMFRLAEIIENTQNRY